MNKITIFIAILLMSGCNRPEQKLLISNEAEVYYANRDISYTENKVLYVKKSKVLYLEIDIEKNQYEKTIKNVNKIFIITGKNPKNIGYMENGDSSEEYDGFYIRKKNNNYTIRYQIDNDISKNDLINISKIKGSCIFIQSEPYIGFPRKLYKSNCIAIKEKEFR